MPLHFGSKNARSLGMQHIITKAKTILADKTLTKAAANVKRSMACMPLAKASFTLSIVCGIVAMAGTTHTIATVTMAAGIVAHTSNPVAQALASFYKALAAMQQVQDNAMPPITAATAAVVCVTAPIACVTKSSCSNFFYSKGALHIRSPAYE